MGSQQPLTIATCGCGSRARTYSKIAQSMPNRYHVVAGADPVPERREAIREISQNENFKTFSSVDEILAEDRLADVMIIATQDNYHYAPAKKALEKGYHILLEKPAAQTKEEVLDLIETARKYNRKILLCFVLRYTPFYSKVHEIVRSGQIGDIISLHATEGAEPWHQAHSFVRGHWAKSKESSPMIIAKCSHDTDYISWLMKSRCTAVSSFGRLSYFTPQNAPQDATYRCTSGCPHAAPQGGNCMFDTHRYLTDKNNWLNMVYPTPEERTNKEVLAWLGKSPWGRCVWQCDNDVVDHQVVNMDFENGTTASLTMTAFDLSRSIEIFGTKATLRGGDRLKESSGCDITIRNHASGELEKVYLEELADDGYRGHGGGDYGVIDALDSIILGEDLESSLIENALDGILIGFAAEESRIHGGKVVDICPV